MSVTPVNVSKHAHKQKCVTGNICVPFYSLYNTSTYTLQRQASWGGWCTQSLTSLPTLTRKKHTIAGRIFGTWPDFTPRSLTVAQPLLTHAADTWGKPSLTPDTRRWNASAPGSFYSSALHLHALWQDLWRKRSGVTHCLNESPAPPREKKPRLWLIVGFTPCTISFVLLLFWQNFQIALCGCYCNSLFQMKRAVFFSSSILIIKGSPQWNIDTLFSQC